jgi:hypothetical protein
VREQGGRDKEKILDGYRGMTCLESSWRLVLGCRVIIDGILTLFAERLVGELTDDGPAVSVCCIKKTMVVVVKEEKRGGLAIEAVPSESEEKPVVARRGQEEHHD